MPSKLLLVLLILSFTGCVTPRGEVSQQKFNSQTGKYETLTMSRVFEGGGVIVSDALELFVGVHLSNDKDVSAAAFSSTPLDMLQWSMADMILYFNSTAEFNINFSIDSLTYLRDDYRDEMIKVPQHITLVPQSTEKIEIKDRPVKNDAQDIILALTYTYQGETISKELHLRRISNTELHQRKGKDWGYFWN